MDDDLVFSENERPRYLLPEGCKDLYDVIRMQERDAAIEKERAAIRSSALEKYASKEMEDPMSTLAQLAEAFEKHLGAPAKELPQCIAIPIPVTVGELAGLLFMQPFKIISLLIKLKIFASKDSEISYETASKICAFFGVAVK